MGGQKGGPQFNQSDVGVLLDQFHEERDKRLRFAAPLARHRRQRLKRIAIPDLLAPSSRRRRAQQKHLARPRRRTLGFARIIASGDEGSGSRFDDLTLTGEVGARLIWPQSTLTVSTLAARNFLEGSAEEDRVGLRATFRWRYDTGTTLAVSSSWQYINHRDNDRRDGQAATLSLTATRPVSPKSSLGVQLAFEDRDLTFELDDFQRLRLTAFGSFDVGRGITLRPSVFVESKLFERTGSVYVESLDETGTGVELSVESSRIILANGFIPYATFTHRRAKSGTSAFSWRDTNLSVGVKQRF